MICLSEWLAAKDDRKDVTALRQRRTGESGCETLTVAQGVLYRLSFSMIRTAEGGLVQEIEIAPKAGHQGI
ncbi:MAG: hypothetical protein ACYC35_11470 [Pirellulales bacterium]